MASSPTQRESLSGNVSAREDSFLVEALRDNNMDGSVTEEPIKNLYDYKMERKFKDEEERKGLLHRMIVISKVQNDNHVEIGQFYERYWKETTNQLQSEGVTGLLLLYPKHSVHILESCQDLLLEYVRHLYTDEINGDGQMAKSKIVLISHDIPQRLHQAWNYRYLDIQAPNLDDITESSDDAASLVRDIILQLIKLGAHINKQPKMALKQIIEGIHDKVPELLPQQDAIHFLLEHDGNYTTTPQEHLHKYNKPYDITLDSELTWPMAVRLFPYN